MSIDREDVKRLVEARKHYPRYSELIEKGTDYTQEIYLMTKRGPIVAFIRPLTESEVQEELKKLGLTEEDFLNKEKINEVRAYNENLAKRALDGEAKAARLVADLTPAELARLVYKIYELNGREARIDERLAFFHSQPTEPAPGSPSEDRVQTSRQNKRSN